MTSIRILADDLTGALDTAAAFSGRMPVFIDRPPEMRGKVDEHPVSVVATPTRDVVVEDIAAHLQPVLGWLCSGGLAFKKVDSLLRGNTFFELIWLARSGRFDTIVFAPAFPAQGRVTIDGQQWVVEPGKPSGPRKAVALPFVEAFSGHHLNLGLNTLPIGSAVNIWAPDVISDEALDAVVVEASGSNARSCLWCGSAGLAQALARRYGLAPDSARAVASLSAGDKGPTVLVSASHHPVFRQQWDILRSAAKPQALMEHASTSELENVLSLVRQGASSAWFDLSPAETVAGLPRPAQLIVVGGDTLLGLCRAAKVDGLLAQASGRSGWGCARLLGGEWDGVPCYSRSGAFGGSDDLLVMTRLLGGSDSL
jgi:D-threonate/D-erythronate kinase